MGVRYAKLLPLVPPRLQHSLSEGRCTQPAGHLRALHIQGLRLLEICSLACTASGSCWSAAAYSSYKLSGLWSCSNGRQDTEPLCMPCTCVHYSALLAAVSDISNWNNVVPCRLESVQLCMSSPSVDDPLDNEEQLADQMDALPYMCRLQYAHTQEYLCGIMDPLITAASERASSGKLCCPTGNAGTSSVTGTCVKQTQRMAKLAGRVLDLQPCCLLAAPGRSAGAGAKAGGGGLLLHQARGTAQAAVQLAAPQPSQQPHLHLPTMVTPALLAITNNPQGLQVAWRARLGGTRQR